MAISPIGPQNPTPPRLQLELTRPRSESAAAESSVSSGPAAAASSFSALLGDAVESMNQLQSAADQKVQKLASGQPVDLHEVMIATEQASLGFQLGLQVRNRLIEAYQEVLRMQV